MGRYTQIMEQVFSIFGSSQWALENVKTHPENYVISGEVSSFIRVQIIPGSQGKNIKSVSGIIAIDIFTAIGEGPKASLNIADKLDKFLCGKSISLPGMASLQMSSSTLGPLKPDKDNKAIAKQLYSIPFTFWS